MPSRPPVAEVRPAAPGADPYAWMRDTADPAMLAYLAAERCYYDQQMAHTGAVRAELMAEMSARMAPATESVSWRRGNFAYFTRNVAGLGHEQFCRRPAGEPDGGTGAPGAAAEVLLDENLLLEDPECGGGYVALGVREVSPDGALLAYSVDFDGDEVYQLRIRDLASGADTVTGAGLPERIGRSYYGLAWSADSRCVFYTVTDAAYRPYQVWRHEIGTDPARDALVFTEHDERFEVEVRATRSGAYVFIETACRDTTETLVIPAGDPRAAPFVLQERRKGVEYRADHADGPDGGEFYLVTNDQAAEFRLVRGPAAGRGRWAEVIAGAAGTRLVSCDVFGRYLVVEQRREAATQLRVIDRETGEQRLIEAAGPEVALALAVNEEYRAAAVTVRTESLIDPPSWHDVDLASGGWRLRRRQEVPGYDPAGYRTRRITAPAPDGTAIPVTIAYRAGLPRDGSAPCLLYGYGAYEDCEWPEFSLPVASLLDRGYLYAVAHVRGGGEGGRRWWLESGWTASGPRSPTSSRWPTRWPRAGGWRPTRSSPAACPRAACCRARSTRWRRGAGGRWWPRCRSWTPSPPCSTPPSRSPSTSGTSGATRATPAARAYLRSYSPYDNIPAGSRPDLLVTGSLHDPRVLVHEPAKWVARLRATGATDGGRVLLRPELGAGAHVGPSGRYDKLAYEAEILAFILDAEGRR